MCAVVALAASCQSDAFDPDALDVPAVVAPNAQPGTGTTVRVGTTVTLDASASFDPDGVIRRYGWQQQAYPPGSFPMIANPTAMTTTVLLEVPGTYEFRLTVVDDDDERDIDSIVFVAQDPGATVDAGADQDVRWHTRVTLDGAYALEDPSDEAIVSWQFAEVPGAVTPTLEGATTLAPSFLAMDVGTYVLDLVVTTGSTTRSDQVSVRVDADVREAPRVDRAHWSAGLQRFVFFGADDPGTLVTLDPATGETASLDLGSGGHVSGLAFDASGTRVALTRDDELFVIDLATAAIVDRYNTQVVADPFTSFAVLYGSNGRVHLFPGYQQLDRVRTIDLSTRAMTTTSMTTGEFYRATERSGTNEIYALRPEELVEWDGSTAPVTVVRSVPARDMILSPTGSFAIETGGRVLDLPALTERAQICLALDSCQPLHHPASHSVAAIGAASGASSGHALELSDDETFAVRSTAMVPELSQNQTPVGMGFNAAGTELYLLLTGSTFTGTSVTRLLTVPL